MKYEAILGRKPFLSDTPRREKFFMVPIISKGGIISNKGKFKEMIDSIGKIMEDFASRRKLLLSCA